MTSETSVDIREVIFVNQRCEKDYVELPDNVLETADAALDTLQNCRALDQKILCALTNDQGLRGIDELRLPYDKDAYRVYIYLACPFAVIVLDAGVKKAVAGKQMPQWQKDRLASRLRDAKAWAAQYRSALEQGFHERARRRAILEGDKSYVRKDG